MVGLCTGMLCLVKLLHQVGDSFILRVVSGGHSRELSGRPQLPARRLLGHTLLSRSSESQACCHQHSCAVQLWVFRCLDVAVVLHRCLTSFGMGIRGLVDEELIQQILL